MTKTYRKVLCILLSAILVAGGSIMAFAASTTKNFTFADLANTRFEFCSGAGAWSTYMNVFKDGHFRGQFHDSNMGDTGEDYKDGTVNICSFYGNFSDPVKVDDYTYKVTKKSLKYMNVPGDYTICDGTRYVYTTAYGLEGNTFYIYLPGTPLSMLDDEIKSWITMGNQSKDVLTMYVIADMDNRTAFTSYSSDVKKDVLNLYEDMKKSYERADHYLYNDAMTQTDMNMTTKYMGVISDYCLNYMWDVIKYNTDDATYQKLLTEQRAWIKEKEQKSLEAAAPYEGGTIYPFIYGGTCNSYTYARCGELAEYIKKL